MGPEILTGTGNKAKVRNMTGPRPGSKLGQVLKYDGTVTGINDWDQLWSGTGTGVKTRPGPKV